MSRHFTCVYCSKHITNIYIAFGAQLQHHYRNSIVDQRSV